LVILPINWLLSHLTNLEAMTMTLVTMLPCLCEVI